MIPIAFKIYSKRGDVNTAEFKQLSDELLEIRDLNRRSDIYVEYVYLIKKHDHSNHYYYLMEVHSGPHTDHTYFGQLYTSNVQIPQGLSSPIVTTHIYTDAWGTWLSGYAPIYDSNGKQLAILGIDVRTKEIYLELENSFSMGL